jgi:hypothetical protein
MKIDILKYYEKDLLRDSRNILCYRKVSNNKRAVFVTRQNNDMSYRKTVSVGNLRVDIYESYS